MRLSSGASFRDPSNDENSNAKLDGVERAIVTEAGLLTAWINPAKTDHAALEAALKKARVELPAP